MKMSRSVLTSVMFVALCAIGCEWSNGVSTTTSTSGRKHVRPNEALRAAEIFARQAVSQRQITIDVGTKVESLSGVDSWKASGSGKELVTINGGLTHRGITWECTLVGRIEDGLAVCQCTSITVDGEQLPCPNEEQAFFDGLPVNRDSNQK